MLRFQTFAYTLSRIAAGVAALALAGMVLHILYEIVLRYFFATSTYVLDEFVGYGVAACTFLALGYALENGNLIRMNALLARTEGTARRTLELLCALLAMTVTAMLIWFFWIRVLRHWTRGTTSSSIAQVPMWIPEGLVLLGLVVFAIQLLAYLLRQIVPVPPPVEADAHAAEL